MFEYTNSSALGVIDTADPLKPKLLCWLSPADGGRFDESASQVLFWAGNKLGAANLATGKVNVTDQLPAAPFVGAFSVDGTMFAYRTGDDNIGISTHLHGGGSDRTLYSEEPIGGHGGPPYGPVDELAFSADGSMLLDFFEFRPPTGPDKLLIFKTADRSIAFKSAKAVAGGVWSTTGSTPYFFVWGQQPPAGDLETLDANGQPETLASNVNGFYWPRMYPQGGSIVYDTYDAAGQPQIWQIDIPMRVPFQMHTTAGSVPVIVASNVLWYNEEKPCQCGPGGLSAPDGVVLAYNTAIGGTTPVDMSQTPPGIGAPQPNTREVVDVLV